MPNRGLAREKVRHISDLDLLSTDYRKKYTPQAPLPWYNMHMKTLKTMAAVGAVAGLVLAGGKYVKTVERLKAEGKTEEEKDLLYKLENQWGKDVLDKFGWTVELEGAENLPATGPVVVVSNHQSYVDIPAIMSVMPFQIGFVAKEELGKIPVFSSWITRLRGLLIKRGDARASLKTISEGVEFLKEGFSVAIFPEGTRSRGPEMGKFKAGSLKLATKAGCPILPVTIDGTYKVYEETGEIKKDQSFRVVVHEPVETAGLDRKGLTELPGKIEEIIKSGF